jgi:hypothetical protein
MPYSSPAPILLKEYLPQGRHVGINELRVLTRLDRLPPNKWLVRNQFICQCNLFTPHSPNKWLVAQHPPGPQSACVPSAGPSRSSAAEQHHVAWPPMSPVLCGCWTPLTISTELP